MTSRSVLIITSHFTSHARDLVDSILGDISELYGMLDWTPLLAGVVTGATLMALVCLFFFLSKHARSNGEEHSTSDHVVARKERPVTRTTLCIKLDGKFTIESFPYFDADKADERGEGRNSNARVFLANSVDVSDVD